MDEDSPDPQKGGSGLFNIWGQSAALGLEELHLDKLDGTDHLSRLKGLGRMPHLESQVNLGILSLAWL